MLRGCEDVHCHVKGQWLYCTYTVVWYVECKRYNSIQNSKKYKVLDISTSEHDKNVREQIK